MEQVDKDTSYDGARRNYTTGKLLKFARVLQSYETKNVWKLLKHLEDVWSSVGKFDNQGWPGMVQAASRLENILRCS